MKLKPHEEFIIWRKRNNFSQAELAERFNVSQGYISHMEQGIRPVPKKIRQVFPRQFRLTEADEFGVRLRRQGLNMNLGVKMFQISHQKLLAFMRGEIDIPKEIWDRLEGDEKKFAEYKEKKAAEAKAAKQ